MEKENIPYADDEYIDSVETGDVFTKNICGRLYDVKVLNDVEVEMASDGSTSYDGVGSADFDNTRFKIELVKASVVRPKLDEKKIQKLRENKKSGVFTALVKEIMELSGILDTNFVDEEKN
jgi:hypothetical protein